MDITMRPVSGDGSTQSKPHAMGMIRPAQTSGDQNSEARITLTLPRNAYFMSGIRDFTLQMVMNMTGFSEQWAFRFQSVVDELCNNAIEHGSGPGTEIKATFISKPNESIEILVEDTQTGMVPRTAEDMRKILKDRLSEDHLQSTSIRGRGLAQIVYSWTDELKFEDREDSKGLRVRAKKYLSKS